MESRKHYELKAWLCVTGAIVFLVGLTLVYHDYHFAPVEWRAGRVLGKERSGTGYGSLENDRRGSVPHDRSSCYIHVDIGGRAGWVTVNSLDYSDWQVGQACEVASRHGRIMDYRFTEIRHPASEKGRGRLAF